MSAGLMRGNGNKAVWRDVTIVDGAVYRLPNGELVRASVEPHPDGLPEYWETSDVGSYKWPVGKGLTLSVLWPEPWADEPGSVGPARVKFLTAACMARVPWSLGYYVFEMNVRPEVWREVRDGDVGSHRTGWVVEDLVRADKDEEFEYRWAVGRASLALGRLMGEK